MRIRDAVEADWDAVGEIRVAAYLAGGFLTADSGYAPTLRSLGADGTGHVLVAVSDVEAGGGQRVVCGTIMLRAWPHAGQLITRPGEAEIRALAVLPQAQGAGIGRQLLSAVIERATAAAVDHLLLYTEPEMLAAHHLYEQAGFVRLPDRDWSPGPGISLLAYGLHLASASGVADDSLPTP